MNGLVLCGCGCGRPVRDQVRSRFVSGHNRRMVPKRRSPEMYVSSKRPDAFSGSTREHIQIAARAVGRRLPPGVVVHHVNGDRSDNRGGNLVICQDQAYHMLLHVRLRALRACGNPDWRPCAICKCYDSPGNLMVYPGTPGRSGNKFLHRPCERRRVREANRRSQARRRTS